MTEQPAPSQPQSNRQMLMLVASVIAVIGIAAAFWIDRESPAQQQKGAKLPPPPAEVSVKDLMEPTAGLPDIGYGKADAPVTIVEYASLSCVHCANFHKNVLPKLKEKYIDTGKVRLIYREFPFDQIGFILSTISRCGGEQKTMALANDFFVKSELWMPPAGNPDAGVRKIWEDNGMKPDELEPCLKNKALQTSLFKSRERASEKFGVRSTPTFFINGKRMTDRSDIIESFDKMIAPLING